MNDELGWVMLTFLVWAWTLFSVEPGISQESVNNANKLCENNGGFKRIEEGYGSFSSVKCNNGAEFEYDWNDLKSEKTK